MSLIKKITHLMMGSASLFVVSALPAYACENVRVVLWGTGWEASAYRCMTIEHPAPGRGGMIWDGAQRVPYRYTGTKTHRSYLNDRVKKDAKIFTYTRSSNGRVYNYWFVWAR